MSGNIAKDYDDHIVVQFEGLTVVVGRAPSDGALLIEIDSDDCELKDVHPGDDVPRIRIRINSHVEQLDELGNWTPEASYPPNVLDHLAVIKFDSGIENSDAHRDG